MFWIIYQIIKLYMADGFIASFHGKRLNEQTVKKMLA